MFHANQSLIYRRNLIVTISDEAGDTLEDPDAQKWLCSSHTTPGSGLLAEVPCDWEDLKIPSMPLTGTTGFLLSLKPNQLDGLFLLNDDVSPRNLP